MPGPDQGRTEGSLQRKAEKSGEEEEEEGGEGPRPEPASGSQERGL
jgi:hypothetical protein